MGAIRSRFNKHCTRGVCFGTSCLLCGLAACAILLSAGCVTSSLATSTGPRHSGEWSVAPVQQVQVGETVAFDFIIVNGLGNNLILADYCLFEIGDDRKIALPDRNGHFTVYYTFDSITDEDRVSALASAWYYRGSPDWTPAGDEAFDSRLPGDEQDQLVAEAGVVLLGYSPVWILEIPVDADLANFNSAEMAIIPDAGEPTLVARESDEHRGFSVIQKGDQQFQVRYCPRPSETPPWGQVEVVFTLVDRDGIPREFRNHFQTP